MWADINAVVLHIARVLRQQAGRVCLLSPILMADRRRRAVTVVGGSLQATSRV